MPQKLGVLCTNNNGQPYASLVTFTVHTDDLKTLIFATDKNTQKYRNILSEPRVAMLINCMSNSESDFENAIAATIIGSAEEVNSD